MKTYLILLITTTDNGVSIRDRCSSPSRIDIQFYTLNVSNVTDDTFLGITIVERFFGRVI